VDEVLDPAGDPVVVLARFALKRAYRKRLGVDAPDVAWVYLAGTRLLLLERMQARSGHFMRAEMLDCQLSALEKPAADEGLTVSIDAPVPEIVAEIQRGLDLRWRQELRFRELP
jgi:gluconokinase